MIGTDVLGLREPFEKYNIGVCCKDLKPETIIEAIKYVDNRKPVMNDHRVCSLRVLGLQEYGFIRRHQIDNIPAG